VMVRAFLIGLTSIRFFLLTMHHFAPQSERPVVKLNYSRMPIFTVFARYKSEVMGFLD